MGSALNVLAAAYLAMAPMPRATASRGPADTQPSGFLQNAATGGVVAVGGGAMPDRIYKKILALSGRVDPRVLVLPLATSEPQSSGMKTESRFRECGARSVDWKFFSREAANDDAVAAAIRAAHVLFFPGGDQKRILDIIKDTMAESAVRDVLAGGGVVGGTSAGCEVLGDLSLTGRARLDLAVIGASEVRPGLGLVKGVLFDQHFLRRGRMLRLVSGTLDQEKKVGIGIDESTAIVLPHGSRTFEVVGDRQVAIFRTGEDTKKAPGSSGQIARASNLRMHLLADGDRYHLDRDEVTFAAHATSAPAESRETGDDLAPESRPNPTVQKK